MRRHRPYFGDADWLDWKGLVERDLMILGDLKCRLKSLWLKLDVMRDKGLLMRMMIWLLLLLLLLCFMEHDDVRPTHILEK